MSSGDRVRDIAFFGATTASVSHELKNVVTIIHETAGLLDDLGLAAERGRPLDNGRVRKIARDVTGHVARAVEILNRLNRFAHSTDEPSQSLELGQLLDDVVALTGRPASLRGSTLEACRPEGPVVVRNRAFGLHQLLTVALRVGFLASPPPPRLLVRLERASEAGATLRIAPVPACPVEAAAASLEALTVLGGELGVRATLLPDGRGAASLELHVPTEPPHSTAGAREASGR